VANAALEFSGSEVRAIVLAAPGRMEPATFDRPKIGDDDGLLLVEANGVCGTGVHFRASEKDTPRILGHEVVGRVLEIGDQAQARWNVNVGDRVAVEAGITCGTCPDCMSGFAQTCQAKLGYGSNVTTDVYPTLWGGFSELMYLAPGTVLTKLDPSVPADVAAGWFSPLANAVDWMGSVGGNVQPGQVVTILGPGPQGLSSCLAAKARGAGLVVVAGLEKDRHRLEAARTLGADRVVEVDNESVVDVVRSLTGGEMSDVVLDVSGAKVSAHIAAELVRRRGTIVAASPINVAEDVGLPLREMIWNGIRWQGVLSNRPAATPAAAYLLNRHVEQLRPLVTHHFGLEDSDKAIDVVAGTTPDTNAIKVVVCPNGSTA
jgi:threonine dehydrogenase-like Zn-dependent dehydrogenase